MYKSEKNETSISKDAIHGYLNAFTNELNVHENLKMYASLTSHTKQDKVSMINSFQKRYST